MLRVLKIHFVCYEITVEICSCVPELCGKVCSDELFYLTTQDLLQKLFTPFFLHSLRFLFSFVVFVLIQRCFNSIQFIFRQIFFNIFMSIQKLATCTGFYNFVGCVITTVYFYLFGSGRLIRCCWDFDCCFLLVPFFLPLFMI